MLPPSDPEPKIGPQGEKPRITVVEKESVPGPTLATVEVNKANAPSRGAVGCGEPDAPALFQRRSHVPLAQGPQGQLRLQLLLGHLQGQRLSVQLGLGAQALLGSRRLCSAPGFVLRLRDFLSFDVLFTELCYQGVIAIIFKSKKDLKVLLPQGKRDRAPRLFSSSIVKSIGMSPTSFFPLPQRLLCKLRI